MRVPECLAATSKGPAIVSATFWSLFLSCGANQTLQMSTVDSQTWGPESLAGRGSRKVPKTDPVDAPAHAHMHAHAQKHTLRTTHTCSFLSICLWPQPWGAAPALRVRFAELHRACRTEFRVRLGADASVRLTCARSTRPTPHWGSLGVSDLQVGLDNMMQPTGHEGRQHTPT